MNLEHYQNPKVFYKAAYFIQQLHAAGYEFLLENLYELCKQIQNIVKNNNKMFKSIGIHFVQSDLSNKSKSKMLRNSTNNLEELEKNVEQLLTDALEDQKVCIVSSLP